MALTLFTTGSFADTKEFTKLCITSDPIHPYIHDLMTNPSSEVRLINENQEEITSTIKEEIYKYYFSGNYDQVIKYLDDLNFTFYSCDSDSISNTLRSIGAVPFSHTDPYRHSMYNLEMIYTITNQIFVSNDRFTGYTDPIWTINYQSPAPITLYSLSLNPGIINSGYTYRLGYSFVVGLYQYIYPHYSNVVYYHYI